MESAATGALSKATDLSRQKWKQGQAQRQEKCVVSLPEDQVGWTWTLSEKLFCLFCDATNWEFPNKNLGVSWPEAGCDVVVVVLKKLGKCRQKPRALRTDAWGEREAEFEGTGGTREGRGALGAQWELHRVACQSVQGHRGAQGPPQGGGGGGFNVSGEGR